MMKLSHESKVRLGVGIGAFVLIIGLVFGVSRTLIHFDGPWDLDDVIPGCPVWTMWLMTTIL